MEINPYHDCIKIFNFMFLYFINGIFFLLYCSAFVFLGKVIQLYINHSILYEEDFHYE